MPFQQLLVAATLAAAVSAPAAERGKVLFSDDFSSAKPGWTGAPGKWEIVDGAAKVTELPENKHAAVRRHAVAYRNAAIEFSFKFDGARQIALSINNKNGHVCRLVLTPTAMVLQTDKPRAASDVKPARLATKPVRISAGEWHKVALEVQGPRMTAVLDGKETITGESAAVDVPKTDIGFPVGGQSAWIDNVRVVELP